jgi:hypothetical protein
MAEAIAALVEALVELLTLVIELLIALFAPLARLLGLASSRGAEPPKAGESPVSPRRLSRAFAPLVVFGVLLAAGAVGVYWFAWRPAQMQRDARDLVDREARRLVDHVDANGRLLPDNDAPRIDDPWGNPLARARTKSRIGETIEVRSFGPDCKVGTPDDIVAIKFAPHPVADIAKDGLRKAAEKLIKRK